VEEPAGKTFIPVISQTIPGWSSKMIGEVNKEEKPVV
jgi:hypothetical protein